MGGLNAEPKEGKNMRRAGERAGTQYALRGAPVVEADGEIRAPNGQPPPGRAPRERAKCCKEGRGRNGAEEP